MLLIDNYKAQTHKAPNYALLKPTTDAPLTFTVGSFTLPTTDPSVFETHSPGELRDLFDKQTKEMEDELTILLRYQLISNSEAERTRKQYSTLYFQDGFAYHKDSLLKTSQSDIQKTTKLYDPPKKSTTQSPSPSSISFTADIAPEEESLLLEDDPRPVFQKQENSNVIGISKQAIRNITQYSYVIQRDWHPSPVTITWQQELIEAPENIIVVDGSRQGGKSMTIAEKLIEESFIPGKDMMVAAFLQETTDSIGEYLIQFLENFPPETFTIKERKRYIQNNESGVRIHFRTLKDGAKGIRGKTLRLIVVDEAMLIPSYIFTSILKPTQTTIANPKMILLGTASEDTSCYMYQLIKEIKANKKYNNQNQQTAKYIKFSINENPLVSPLMKQEIMDSKDNPNVQREYFNRWGKLEDSLFRPNPEHYSDIHQLLSPQAHIILAIDPARKQDRSAFSIIHCINGHATTLESGEVPASHKIDWTLQGQFFLNLIKKYQPYRSISAAIDSTGVGDGAMHIFRQIGVPIQDTVRYTAGDTESKQGEGNYIVGKSLLINNLVDMLAEKNLHIPIEFNELLLQEMDLIQPSQTRTGKLSFTTDGYDDVTNSLMIGLYVAKKRGFINRISTDTTKPQTFDEELKSYIPKNPRWNKKQQTSGW